MSHCFHLSQLVTFIRFNSDGIDPCMDRETVAAPISPQAYLLLTSARNTKGSTQYPS